jgi:hypothetical protein
MELYEGREGGREREFIVLLTTFFCERHKVVCVLPFSFIFITRAPHPHTPAMFLSIRIGEGHLLIYEGGIECRRNITTTMKHVHHLSFFFYNTQNSRCT